MGSLRVRGWAVAGGQGGRRRAGGVIVVGGAFAYGAKGLCYCNIESPERYIQTLSENI